MKAVISLWQGRNRGTARIEAQLDHCPAKGDFLRLPDGAMVVVYGVCRRLETSGAAGEEGQLREEEVELFARRTFELHEDLLQMPERRGW